MRVLVSAFAICASGLHELTETADQGGCIAPGTCTPPPATYTKVLDVKPRQQWNTNGGFCGAMSIQTGALAVGAWISQDLVRKANTHGEGHGTPELGYEVLPSNVGETHANLKLDFDEWDYMQPKPQAAAFKVWIKSHLVQGHPIVWFPICKGDSHDPYSGTSDNPNGGAYDHVEPMWGIGSNHPLDDPAVYEDDWILHGSDQDYEPYYRFMSTLEDDLSMEGNCKDAQAGFGKNEMYPCIYNQVTYGAAIKGLKTVASLPVTLNVDSQSEPQIRKWAAPSRLHGTVTVSGLAEGETYTLYRYGSTEALPSIGGSLEGYEYKTEFTAEAAIWTYMDPQTFMSNSATYYIALPNKADLNVV